jgi:hypothetical protein
MIGSMGTVGHAALLESVFGAPRTQVVVRPAQAYNLLSTVASAPKAAIALAGGVPAAPAFVRAAAPPPEESEGTSPLVVAGAAIVGLGIIGAIVYRMRKRR